MSTTSNPQRKFKIHRPFTADQLGLAEYTYPVSAFQEKYSMCTYSPFHQGMAPTSHSFRSPHSLSPHWSQCIWAHQGA